MKKLFIILLFIIISSLGRHLLPNNYFFTFHDSTQPARIQQFVKELKNFHIPPRVAPDMNYQLGYPVFNFYAPASYWITSVINIIGFDVVNSLKLSFLLALTVGFLGTYLFFKKFFDFLPSILGGFFYITSLYFPLNIFVRGNLGETWFLALLPLTMALLLSANNLPVLSILLSFLFTSHNILSLISIPFILIFTLLIKNKKKNLISIILGLLLSSYFWLPAILEMKYTWAKEIATITNFNDHFLCLNQLWQSQWGFGGSTKGCLNDGMSFMIGKLQIIFFVLGLILFIIRKKENKNIYWFFILTTLTCLFLTSFQSRFIWNLFSPIMSIIQFPWRFIGLSLIGISFFSAYFFHRIKILFKNLLIFAILATVLIINGKYFQGQ
ncbi:MAG: hypothetical protein NC935_07480, partial [Candidatus Omnitrophica bacterium]|nr:hypothetical protein [Candidatus Omnitrophota bacterium]